jgi:hypothetical protein
MPYTVIIRVAVSSNTDKEYFMASIFPFPMNVPIAVSDSYQRQNTLIYAQMAGHLSISLSNMDNSSAPKVLEGSVFNINTGLYKVEADENIGGSPAAGQNYIYAIPGVDPATGKGSAAFQYSATKPVWNAAKNGWYHSSSDPALQGARAVATFNYSGTAYNSKAALGSLGGGEYNSVRVFGGKVEFWNGAAKVSEIAMSATGLQMSGLLTAEGGILSQGDIRAYITNPGGGPGKITVKLVFNSNGSVTWTQV